MLVDGATGLVENIMNKPEGFRCAFLFMSPSLRMVFFCHHSLALPILDLPIKSSVYFICFFGGRGSRI